MTHTHASFGWMAASAATGLGITPADVFLSATSVSHVAACSPSFGGLAAGVRVAVARSFGGDEVLSLLRLARPTLLCMLPAPCSPSSATTGRPAGTSGPAAHRGGR